jgi:hypothetical protein
MIVANNEGGFSVVMGADEPHLNLTTFPSVMVTQRNAVLIPLCSILSNAFNRAYYKRL